MQVVPIKGDRITTTEGVELVVDSYTNHKTEPAVYVDVPIGQNNIVYFSDIEQINGIKVELNKSTKVFEALGVLKRKVHLPQYNDEIKVKLPDAPEDSEEAYVVVKTIKLHNKALGLSKVLVVVDKEDRVYTLPDVLDVSRAVGGDKFHKEKFRKVYKDYFPYSRK